MSEYSAEELLRLSQFVKDMQSILGGSRDDNDDDEARAWDDYEKASSALAAYAKRIKADKGVVPDGWAKPEEIESYRRAAAKPRGTNGGGFGVSVSNKPGGIYTLPVYFTHPPAQAAQSVDIEAIREVIEVRDWLLARAQDGQMQRSVYTSNYQLREMAEAINVFADKLEAALPELKP